MKDIQKKNFTYSNEYEKETINMAKKGAQKTNLEANEIFLQYEEEIVNDPVYAGMPDLRHDDGTIQWEAPSNRGSGVFQFSHDKRYQWWINKASEVGINTSEDKWISKVAKKIHPTKLHPCKVCGRIMDIRYCYLSANFMKRVKKLPFYDEQVDMDEITHITDFIASFTDTYGDKAYDALPELLKCSQVKSIPTLPHDLSSWTDWINSEYIPKEPSMLGPGAMSNAPDRLDGFHTYDRCCRPTADKGRSKENLASYSTDRRAFENWSDGNWIQANKLMGYINSNSELKKQQCANHSTGSFHPRPCSADHIGPISLGFSHRPEFQLLCKPCNSAKNNRMYYSDVQHLISVEEGGSTVTTWYAAPIWQRCKQKVYDKESALKLSRIMRDNRNIAMMLLADFVKRDEFLFLLTLLNLNYADYDYEIDPATLNVNNQIVTVQFISKPSTLRYVNIQKIRKIRVAFSSLIDYANKENRNGFMYTNDEIEHLKQQAFSTLSSVNTFLSNKNKDLKSAISNEATTDTDLEIFLQNIDYTELLDVPQFKDVKNLLVKIMSIVADALSSKWDDSRYSRDIDE
jgi:Alw26I/Eco31I/Esp3I family type II restriction endonuclease